MHQFGFVDKDTVILENTAPQRGHQEQLLVRAGGGADEECPEARVQAALEVHEGGAGRQGQVVRGLCARGGHFLRARAHRARLVRQRGALREGASPDGGQC
eukprot:579204-Pyramimonas_sp.AAC.2